MLLPTRWTPDWGPSRFFKRSLKDVLSEIRCLTCCVEVEKQRSEIRNRRSLHPHVASQPLGIFVSLPSFPVVYAVCTSRTNVAGSLRGGYGGGSNSFFAASRISCLQLLSTTPLAPSGGRSGPTTSPPMASTGTVENIKAVERWGIRA
jgi:hypothetical protein